MISKAAHRGRRCLAVTAAATCLMASTLRSQTGEVGTGGISGSVRDSTGAVFTPEDSTVLFKRHADWLASRLATPHDEPTVVITHHAPSPRSIHPRFAGSLLNACFVSDAESLLGADRALLWIHGHTHDSFD